MTTISPVTRPANDNAPIVVLHPTGDGVTLYRALARVLVRRELFSSRTICASDEPDDCAGRKAAT